MNNEIYHPLDMNDSLTPWIVCHYLLGAKVFSRHDLPHTVTNDMLPSWYQQLSDSSKEDIWQKQEQYLSRLLDWFAEKGIEDAFISEPEGDALPQELSKTGHFAWNETLSQVIPHTVFFNLYLKAKDASILIAYESDTETVFLYNASGELPVSLTKAAVKEAA